MSMATPMYRQDEMRNLIRLGFYTGLTVGSVCGGAIAMWIAVAVFF